MGKVVAQAIMSLDGYVARQDNTIGRSLRPDDAGGHASIVTMVVIEWRS